MELVLVRFQVAELCELLIATVQLADKWFSRGMYDLVSSNIPVLCESLEADVALVRSFSRVSSFMCLEIAELAESLTTICLFTEERLDACVRSVVDIEVRFLIERFAAVGYLAQISLSGTTGG